MVVYPAAGLIHYVPVDSVKYVVDPKLPEMREMPFLKMVEEKASVGMEVVRRELLMGEE